jgi:predicted nucleic acid-binding protein
MMFVVDTGIVISALIKDSLTRKVIMHPAFELFAPEDINDEIEEHIDEIVKKSKVTRKRVYDVLDTLLERISIVPAHDFSGHYQKAYDHLKGIDQDDAPFLALALSFENDGIWSNDSHLHEQNLVRVWTTEDVLEELRSYEEFI